MLMPLEGQRSVCQLLATQGSKGAGVGLNRKEGNPIGTAGEGVGGHCPQRSQASRLIVAADAGETRALFGLLLWFIKIQLPAAMG